MTRQVAIIVKSTIFDQLQTAFQNSDWQAVRVSEYDPMPQSACKPYAGLIQFTGIEKAELYRLQQLTACMDGTEWIALVPRYLLTDSRMCKLVKTHFYDFHTLPLDLPRLFVSLGHAYGKARLQGRDNETTEKNGQYGLIGTSKAMRKLYQLIEKISASDAPVLIGGESGTGKELTARAIHKLSARREAPFVAVNCAALPANLIQSELFGHEKGAFTGAHQRKIGRLEAAAGGTIFLDEIGDLPKPLQVNLLRILQEQVIERLGSNHEIRLNVRMIAASHVNLAQAVQEGLFREDLYYRLNVLGLVSPPLREREQDVEALAVHFFEKFSQESKSIAVGFSEQALRVMNRYSWPGNVRELINRVRQAVIMSESRLITPVHLGLEKRILFNHALTLEKARAQADNEIIRSALRRNRNNISEAARQLGVSRATLYRLLDQTKIKLANGHIIPSI